MSLQVGNAVYNAAFIYLFWYNNFVLLRKNIVFLLKYCYFNYINPINNIEGDLMFDLDTCVAFVTSKASKKMTDAFNDRLMAKGISRVQWIALYYLGKFQEINQKQLAEKMDIKDSTVVRLLDRMEKEGYVTRVKTPSDRRNTMIVLTEKGNKLRDELLPEGEIMSKIFSQNVSEAEIEVFKSVLKKMLDNIS